MYNLLNNLKKGKFYFLNQLLFLFWLLQRIVTTFLALCAVVENTPNDVTSTPIGNNSLDNFLKYLDVGLTYAPYDVPKYPSTTQPSTTANYDNPFVLKYAPAVNPTNQQHPAGHIVTIRYGIPSSHLIYHHPLISPTGNTGLNGLPQVTTQYAPSMPYSNIVPINAVGFPIGAPTVTYNAPAHRPVAVIAHPYPPTNFVAPLPPPFQSIPHPVPQNIQVPQNAVYYSAAIAPQQVPSSQYNINGNPGEQIPYNPLPHVPIVHHPARFGYPGVPIQYVQPPATTLFPPSPIY